MYSGNVQQGHVDLKRDKLGTLKLPLHEWSAVIIGNQGSDCLVSSDHYEAADDDRSAAVRYLKVDEAQHRSAAETGLELRRIRV